MGWLKIGLQREGFTCSALFFILFAVTQIYMGNDIIEL